MNTAICKVRAAGQIDTRLRRFLMPLIGGIPLASSANTFYRSKTMGQEDVAAGKAKQVKGKVNDVAGAVKGDTGQQIKGKVQGAVGKIQEKLGKGSK